MSNDETYIPSELKQLEDSYTYLSGMGMPDNVAMNMLFLSVEMQKLNVQARMMVRNEESKVSIDEVAERVAEILERNSRDSRDSEA